MVNNKKYYKVLLLTEVFDGYNFLSFIRNLFTKMGNADVD